MFELHEGLSVIRPKKKPLAKKPLIEKQKPTVLDDLINEIDSMESTQLRNEASKDKLIGGQGTRQGKLMLYQQGDGNFYMTLKGKRSEMNSELVKNRSDAIKAATMFAKMINAR
tara:strand:+ start:5614 stop:5955 length:342 start_codon:yes stop_codon:yes gene_type:complete